MSSEERRRLERSEEEQTKSGRAVWGAGLSLASGDDLERAGSAVSDCYSEDEEEAAAAAAWRGVERRKRRKRREEDEGGRLGRRRTEETEHSLRNERTWKSLLIKKVEDGDCGERRSVQEAHVDVVEEERDEHCRVKEESVRRGISEERRREGGVLRSLSDLRLGEAELSSIVSEEDQEEEGRVCGDVCDNKNEAEGGESRVEALGSLSDESSAGEDTAACLSEESIAEKRSSRIRELSKEYGGGTVAPLNVELCEEGSNAYNFGRSCCYTVSEGLVNSFPHLSYVQRKCSEFNIVPLKLKEKYSEPDIFHITKNDYGSFSDVSLNQTINIEESNNQKGGPSESTVSNSLFDFSKKSDDCYLYSEENFIKSFKNQHKFYSRTNNIIRERNELDFKESKSDCKEKDSIFQSLMEIVENTNKIIPMKNITHSSTSTQTFKEESAQTNNADIYKEKSIATEGNFKGDTVSILKTVSTTTEGICILSVESTMDLLKEHLNNIIYDRGIQPSLNEMPSSDQEINDNLCVYAQSNINKLFLQIKQIYSFLDSKVNSKDNIRHQRYYSEDVKKKISFFGSGDINQDQEPETITCPNDNHLTSKRVGYFTNSGSICAQIAEEDEQICRTFELNPYDDLIRSYQSHADRRIKAVGNKMKCKILIDGPIRIYDSTHYCWNSRSKTAFRCIISGTSKDVVDKCLRCLQDTFPLSHLNEKRLRSKLENKTYIY